MQSAGEQCQIRFRETSAYRNEIRSLVTDRLPGKRGRGIRGSTRASEASSAHMPNQPALPGDPACLPVYIFIRIVAANRCYSRIKFPRRVQLQQRRLVAIGSNDWGKTRVFSLSEQIVKSRRTTGREDPVTDLPINDLKALTIGSRIAKFHETFHSFIVLWLYRIILSR